MLFLIACASEPPEPEPSALAAASHTPGELVTIGTEGVTVYVIAYDDLEVGWKLSSDGMIAGTPVEQAGLTGSMVSLAYDEALDGQTLYATLDEETFSWPLAVE